MTKNQSRNLENIYLFKVKSVCIVNYEQYLTPFSNVSIIDFGQVNICWEDTGQVNICWEDTNSVSSHSLNILTTSIILEPFKTI